MRHLLLIRHAAPTLEPNRPAEDWTLSAAGRAGAGVLAEAVRPFAPARMVSSEAPKAIETAQIIAASLDVPWQTAPDLHEHDRRNAPFGGSEWFKENVRRLFNEPDVLFFGQETATAALQRYRVAVDAVLASFPTESVAIVSHGTVMTLLLAERATVDPIPFWEGLRLPHLVPVRLPAWEIVDGEAARTG